MKNTKPGAFAYIISINLLTFPQLRHKPYSLATELMLLSALWMHPFQLARLLQREGALTLLTLDENLRPMVSTG